MMNVEEFIKDLNIILTIEYGAVLQYVLHSYRLSRNGDKDTANELMQLMNDEIRHAESLAQKIKGLGGKPTVKAEWAYTQDNLEQMLKVNLISEKRSISIYQKLIKIADKNGYKGIIKLLEEQCEDELRHVQVLQKYMESQT